MAPDAYTRDSRQTLQGERSKTGQQRPFLSGRGSRTSGAGGIVPG